MHTKCIKKPFISNMKLLNLYSFRDESMEKFMHKKTNKSCVFSVILVESRFKHLSKSKMAESPCLWELQPLLFSKVCCTETLSRNFFDFFIQLLRLVILPV